MFLLNRAMTVLFEKLFVRNLQTNAYFLISKIISKLYNKKTQHTIKGRKMHTLCNRSFRIRRILRRYCGDERNRRRQLVEMMQPRPLPQLPPCGCKGVEVAVGGGDEKRLKRG